jgi:ribosome-associated heat shock protein Hsp15
MESQVRIDKFLWATRVFKTRSLAAQACDLKKIKIKGQLVKASRTVKVGDEISVKHGPFERQFKVVQLLQNRVSAKLVPDYSIEITPADTIEKMKAHYAARAAWRTPGLGRPTKKERRDLDDFTDMDW